MNTGLLPIYCVPLSITRFKTVPGTQETMNVGSINQNAHDSYHHKEYHHQNAQNVHNDKYQAPLAAPAMPHLRRFTRHGHELKQEGGRHWNEHGGGPAAKCDEKQNWGGAAPTQRPLSPPPSESLGTQLCHADHSGTSAGNSALPHLWYSPLPENQPWLAVPTSAPGRTNYFFFLWVMGFFTCESVTGEVFSPLDWGYPEARAGSPQNLCSARFEHQYNL